MKPMFRARTQVATGVRLIGALFICFLFPTGVVADVGTLSEVHRVIPGYQIGNETLDMPVADFDGDGRDDFVILGKLEYTYIVQIVGLDVAQAWKVKQSLIPGGAISSGNFPTLSVWTEEDGPHLLVSKDLDIYEYSGWPLSLTRIRTLPGVHSFSDLEVADVDNDGIRELIVSSTDSDRALQAYNLQTGGLLWEVLDVSLYSDNLLVAQLDGDPALEIVTGLGFVIDGATHAIEWNYKDGFGYSRVTGRFGGLQPQFASLGYRLTMFQSGPWSPLWDIDAFSSSSLAVADVDGDEIDEIIFDQSDTFPYGVQVFDVQTQQTRTQFDIPNAVRLAAADFDADGATEIAASTYPGFYDNPTIVLQVLDGISGAAEFSLEVDAPGPYHVAGFASDAQSADIIFGTSAHSYSPGIVTRADPTSGELRWKTPAYVPGQASPPLFAQDIRIAKVAGRDDPVVIVVGEKPYGITALDALDGSVLWALDEVNNGGLPQYPYVKAITAVDEDADGLAETLLACTRERLYQFRIDTQAPVWSSVAMSSQCIDVMVIKTGRSLIYVAVLQQALRAYDSQSHLLLWSLPAPDSLQGASYIADGQYGPELALFYHNVISFYDAATRVLLRELTLPEQTQISAVVQPVGASIHQLVIAQSGKLRVVDGISGAVTSSSEFLGRNLGEFNKIANMQLDASQFLIVSGSDAGVFSHQLKLNSDIIYVDGFDPSAP